MKKLSRKAKRIHKKARSLFETTKRDKLVNSKKEYTEEMLIDKFINEEGYSRLQAHKKITEFIEDIKLYLVCPICDLNLKELYRITHIDGFGNVFGELSTIYCTNKNCDFKMEFNK